MVYSVQLFPGWMIAFVTVYVELLWQQNHKIYRKFNPLTTGAVHIRFLHFILTHYISAFKPVKDKKDINQQDLNFFLPLFCQI